MKHSRFILGFLVFGLIFGFTFFGCDNGTTDNDHTHDYSTTWSFDATQHWHECSCGEKKDVANHTGDPCTVCNYAVAKKLTITDTSGFSSSHIAVMLRTTDDLASGEWIAGGSIAISSGTATIQLKNAISPSAISSVNWTGKGQYYVYGWETSGANVSGVPFYVSKNKINFVSENTNVTANDITTTMSLLIINGLQTARAGKALTVGLFAQGTLWTAVVAQTATSIAGFARTNTEVLSNDIVPLFVDSNTAWKGTGTFEVFVIIGTGGTAEIWQKQVTITNVDTTEAFNTFTKRYP